MNGIDRAESYLDARKEAGPRWPDEPEPEDSEDGEEDEE